MKFWTVFLISLLGFASAKAGGDHVHSKVSPVLVQLPETCFAKQTFPCAVQVLSLGELAWGQRQLRTSLKAQLLFLGPDLVQVVKGDVWVRGQKEYNIKFGETLFASSGDVFYQRDGQNVEVTALSGVVRVSGPKGQSLSLPAGFKNWYVGLNQSADVEQGVLQAYDLKDFAAKWFRLVGTEHTQFEDVILSYKQQQKTAVAQSGELYQQVIKIRQIASENIEKEKQRKIQRQENENRKFRQMFRMRYFQGIEADPQT